MSRLLCSSFKIHFDDDRKGVFCITTRCCQVTYHVRTILKSKYPQTNNNVTMAFHNLSGAHCLCIRINKWLAFKPEALFVLGFENVYTKARATKYQSSPSEFVSYELPLEQAGNYMSFLQWILVNGEDKTGLCANNLCHSHSY